MHAEDYAGCVIIRQSSPSKSGLIPPSIALATIAIAFEVSLSMNELQFVFNVYPLRNNANAAF